MNDIIIREYGLPYNDWFLKSEITVRYCPVCRKTWYPDFDDTGCIHCKSEHIQNKTMYGFVFDALKTFKKD